MNRHGNNQVRRGRRALRVPVLVLALVLVLAAALVAASCSSGDDDSSATTVPSKVTSGGAGHRRIARPGPPGRDAVATPTVTPATGGTGTATLGPPGTDLAKVGYTESEFFISGTANAYTASGPLPSDGKWTVTTRDPKPYTTRIVVRRPADPAKFNGTVVVEWLNVSGGLDASPDWTYTHTELLRSGTAWVGVSAQKVGIEGGGSSLGAALALKNADPARYASLVHPGDDYSYDMFSQAGAAVWFDPAVVLSGLEPTQVLAAGESQSAFRLSTYVNAVAPTSKVFDGYFIHSRSSGGAPLSTVPGAEVNAPDPNLTRTDLDVPVLTLSSESDLVGRALGYARARQPDTDVFRGWEMPGTAHADAYMLGIGDTDDGSGAADRTLFQAMSNPPATAYFGVIKCGSPINTGPHTYVARSAIHDLAAWSRTGTPPPKMPRLDLNAAGDGYVLDARGNATGGIRTPQVDRPVAKLSGLGQSGSSFCFLFGTTVPLDAAALGAKAPAQPAFLTAWDASVDDAVRSGAVLEADAEHIKQAARPAPAGG